MPGHPSIYKGSTGGSPKLFREEPADEGVIDPNVLFDDAQGNFDDMTGSFDTPGTP